jgi:DNA-binding NtrC family response regulator
LFFRLNVLALHIPPLRARPADILTLAEHFATRYAHANGLPARAISAPAVSVLLAHPWPGNVRELENCLHRAVLLAEGAEIGTEAIELIAPRRPAEPPQVAAATTAPTPATTRVTALVGRKVDEVERELILETLSHCLGNRTRAAEILGISIRTLRNKLQEYRAAGLTVPPAPGQAPIILPGVA